MNDAKAELLGFHVETVTLKSGVGKGGGGGDSAAMEGENGANRIKGAMRCLQWSIQL